MSGLTSSIQNAEDNETIDLAGKSASTIETAVKDAFAKPFPLSETIRITFVTGAGKLARQKYDDNAARVISTVLKGLGYEEDQSGGAGTFKLQHDTGKNLKTLVVYPQIAVTSEDAANNGSNKSEKPVLAQNSIEYKVAYSPMPVFEKMVQEKCSSWLQKRSLAETLDDLMSKLKTLEETLFAGTPLTEPEQYFYDNAPLTLLEKKVEHVRKLMHEHIEKGDITAKEKEVLLDQINTKLNALDQNPKSSAQVEKLKARKEKIEKISPSPPHKLLHHDKISKLYKDLKPFIELENSAKGRLLSVKESQELAKKDKIMDEIDTLQKQSRGWYESDEELKSRLDYHTTTAKAKPSTKAAAAAKVVRKPASQGSAWKTTAVHNLSGPAKPRATKKSGDNKGSVFAAMMDSDSD